MINQILQYFLYLFFIQLHILHNFKTRQMNFSTEFLLAELTVWVEDKLRTENENGCNEEEEKETDAETSSKL